MNDGGPAFPETRIEQNEDPRFSPPSMQHYSGMTLRDYFAAKAMQSLIAFFKPPYPTEHEKAVRNTATAAYVLADAMLAARNK